MFYNIQQNDRINLYNTCASVFVLMNTLMWVQRGPDNDQLTVHLPNLVKVHRQCYWNPYQTNQKYVCTHDDTMWYGLIIAGLDQRKTK